MVDQTGNAIPVTGFTIGPSVPDEEILYSTVGFTQKGVTLAAGQGKLQAGTVLARRTSTNFYEKYNSAGSDGLNVAVGILRKSVETGSDANGQKYNANIVIAGIMKLKSISSANAGVPSVLSAVTNSVLGTFKI